MELAAEFFRWYLLGCAINAVMVLIAAIHVKNLFPNDSYPPIKFLTIASACLLSWVFSFIAVYSITTSYLLQGKYTDLPEDDEWYDDDDN